MRQADRQPLDAVHIERMRMWVDRLRDPKSKQAKKKLRGVKDRTAFCCLGHACDVSGLGEWRASGQGDREKYVVEGDVTSGSTEMTPRSVAEWFGFNDPNPLLIAKRGGKAQAGGLNDVHGYTLSEIADAIERRWPEIKREEKS